MLDTIARFASSHKVALAVAAIVVLLLWRALRPGEQFTVYRPPMVSRVLAHRAWAPGSARRARPSGWAPGGSRVARRAAP